MRVEKYALLVVVSFVVLVGVAFADDNPSVLSYSTKTQDKISGSTFSSGAGNKAVHPEVAFSAENKRTDETIEVSLLLNNKQVNVIIGYGSKDDVLQILGSDGQSQTMMLTESDSALIHRALDAVSQENTGSDVLVSKLTRVLNLLDFWPSTLPVNFLNSVEQGRGTNSSVCGLSMPRPLSTSLCSLFANANLTNPAYVTKTGRLCSGTASFDPSTLLIATALGVEAAGAWLAGQAVLWEPIDSLDITTIPTVLGGDSCVGRCGKGCNQVGFNPVNEDRNIYTQACFDHDVCADQYTLGIADPRCNYLFLPCITDAIKGTDCQIAPTLVYPAQDSKIAYDVKGVQFEWTTNFPGASLFHFWASSLDGATRQGTVDVNKWCTKNTTGGWQMDCKTTNFPLPAGNYTWAVYPLYLSGKVGAQSIGHFWITPQACSTTTVAGNDDAQTVVIDMGKTGGSFTFTYDTYSIPDEIKLTYEGKTIYDTGCVGASGSKDLTFGVGTTTSITAIVTPNCSGGTSGTAWEFSVSCPK
ncbi:hypothetical protein [Candidatus Magnetominusculus dajiuhuensis]|uniref:hypothetical protein n=1 Tax=Candidatus Magnetominusculus dajiuhuensis TaxID=3137712 RepID=UPI003B4340BF